MPAHPVTQLSTAVAAAAANAGLTILSAEEGADFHGHPTAVFHVGLSPDAPAGRALRLELSENFDFHRPELLPEMTAHLQQEAKRLRNPRPDAYVTTAGMPITFGDFRWPFHRSTSGADTYIVHGVVHAADSADSPLHAKVSASMTVTFAEIVPAPEQPYAETFIYNAVRKTLDQGQLELLKSGNRQPVPVTTRYYSRWQKKFFFTDTTDESRAPVSGSQDLLAVRHTGQLAAGLDCRPPRCSVPQHHLGRTGSGSFGVSRCRDRDPGQRQRICCGNPRFVGPRS